MGGGLKILGRLGKKPTPNCHPGTYPYIKRQRTKYIAMALYFRITRVFSLPVSNDITSGEGHDSVLFLLVIYFFTRDNHNFTVGKKNF